MAITLLTLAVLLGAVAVGTVVVSALLEAIESHEISEHGWVRGHRVHRHHSV